MYPTFQGCYVSVRYAGINADAQLHIVDGVTYATAPPYRPTSSPCAGRRCFSSATTTSSACGPPRPSADAVVCDIELVRVQPGDRLSGRYANDL
jgi:hypothetical protein